jgi:hypothetical protein
MLPPNEIVGMAQGFNRAGKGQKRESRHEHEGKFSDACRR